MKERDTIKSIVLVLCIICKSMTGSAHANEAEKASQGIAALNGKIDRVVIIIAPVAMSFNRRMDEKDLPAIGCRYEMEHEDAVMPLMRLLAGSRFIADPMPERKLDVKLGIYLYQADALKARLLFEQALAYGPDDALASGDARGSYDGEPLAAAAPLVQEVRTLVGRLQTAGPNFYCDFARK